MAHPPGIISESACAENLLDNQIEEVCLGTIGTGSLHSDKVPETILALYIKYLGDKAVALPVTATGAPTRFKLLYVLPSIPKSGAIKFARFNKFEVLSNEESILGIKGAFEDSPFEVLFKAPISVDHFSL